MPAEENPQSISIANAVSEVLSSGVIAMLATLIEGPTGSQIGAKILFHPEHTIGSLGDKSLDDVVVNHASSLLTSKHLTVVSTVNEFAPELAAWAEAKVLFERIQAEPRLVICGAGHVGAALAKLGSMLGFQSTLIDDRVEFVSAERFDEGNIDLVAATNWSKAIAEAIGNGRGVSVAIVTRGHSEDEQCLRAVIEKEVDYIGMIGSKRRTNIVLDRLRQTGIGEEKIAKVHAPVGLDIGAVTPEEVALAIMAEVVAVRRGGRAVRFHRGAGNHKL